MSDKIVNLIQLIDDIKAEIEEKKIRCEFDEVDRLGFKLKTAKDKLVDAVKMDLLLKERNNSEQKEPCDFCKYIYTIEATSYTYTEPIASLSGLNEINYCPKCGRPLNQPSATDNNVGE